MTLSLHRRHLLGAAGLTLGGAGAPAHAATPDHFESRRPPADKRSFSSPAVEATVTAVSARLKDPELAWLFANCFPNTLDTTVSHGTLDGKPDTYVITGDIDAMWLHDSAAQVWPYLPLMKQDPALERLIAGVVNRQAHCVRIDPYANAFYKDAARISGHKNDKTEMKPGVHERKWEVDSLCYVIRLAHGYWRAGGDPACFDAPWLDAMRLIVRTFKEQQRKTGRGPYAFRRHTEWPSDTAAADGYGNPVKPTGLICSMFRPSDDGTIFPYLVPSNCFAVVSLRQLAELVAAHFAEPAFVAECRALASEVEAALQRHAVVDHPVVGRMLAYEVDGYGGRFLADDANVPSLLSLPYLGAIAPGQAALYRNTRRFLLSPELNPYFAKGRAAEGMASPHTGQPNIWPMGIIMRGLTATSPAEVAQCLQWLKTTHAGTGFMHESFHKDDPAKFTRPWFAWANTLFGEFLLQVLDKQPRLLTG
jgi:uncharacterized protein